MSYPEVEIVNIALNLLGRESIRDFSVSDTDPKTGRLAERIYKISRDKLLSKHDWSFARKTSVLQKVTEGHIEGVLYKLPSKCFVPRRIGPRGGKGNNFRIEGRDLLILDGDTISAGVIPYLRYTQYIKETSWFPPYFIDALAKEIEYRLCMPITKDKKRSKELASEARGYFLDAAHIDSNLDSGDDYREIDRENDSYLEPDAMRTQFDGQ